METICTHLAEVREVQPGSAGCAECIEAGTAWHHLRICLCCGYVGCCNGSPARHAIRHFLETGHPLVQSYEPGDEWAFCYVDEMFLLPQATIHPPTLTLAPVR